jgi:hypothetical protein
MVVALESLSKRSLDGTLSATSLRAGVCGLTIAVLIIVDELIVITVLGIVKLCKESASLLNMFV